MKKSDTGVSHEVNLKVMQERVYPTLHTFSPVLATSKLTMASGTVDPGAMNVESHYSVGNTKCMTGKRIAIRQSMVAVNF